MIARRYIDEGYQVNGVLPLCTLSKSSYYYRLHQGQRGRKPSTHTMDIRGFEYSNELVVDDIEILLGMEFVDYGYEKVTDWLKDEKGYIINDKKVYRLMKKHRLLNNRIVRNRQGKHIAKYLLPRPQDPFEHMQIDIKYIYIHGCHKNALLITVLDVYSRGALSFRLEWSIRKYQVIELMQDILAQYRLPEKVTVRTDNGSQFEASLWREYLYEMKIEHEFTHVASPQENCYIESFHSIVESVVCQKYELESLQEAQQIFERFMNFYNQERLHGGIGNEAPAKFLWKNKQKELNTLNFYSINQDILPAWVGMTNLTGQAGFADGSEIYRLKQEADFRPPPLSQSLNRSKTNKELVSFKSWRGSPCDDSLQDLKEVKKNSI